MSLSDWEQHGWLTRHTTSRTEIRDLLAVVDRDLADCRYLKPLGLRGEVVAWLSDNHGELLVDTLR